MEIVITKDNFVTEVENSELPVLLDFWAPWCGPCRMIAPAVAKIADAYAGRVKVGKVNVDEEAELAMKFGIVSIPTLLVLKNSTVVNKSVGLVTSAQIEQLLK